MKVDFIGLQPIDEVNRLELIQDRIKDFIISNKLQPGDKLPTEEQLAKMLRVSRTAIREAFRSLEALGIVEARQGYGRVVCDFNFNAIVNNLSYGLAFRNYGVYQAHQIRKSLESYFIKLAVENLSDDDVEQLAVLAQRMKAVGDNEFEQFRQEDYRFHHLIFQRCGNELALQLFEITWKVADAALNQHRIYKELPVELADEHMAMVEAMRRRDGEQARQMLLLHFRSVEQRLMQRLEQEKAAGETISVSLSE